MLVPLQVLMRYGRQRWRMRGRVEVSSRQVWDSEDYIFLPLVTELLSIKVRARCEVHSADRASLYQGELNDGCGRP